LDEGDFAIRGSFAADLLLGEAAIGACDVLHERDELGSAPETDVGVLGAGVRDEGGDEFFLVETVEGERIVGPFERE
jgi:hypothetical protein